MFELIAFIPDPNDPGKLKVGPKSLYLTLGYDDALEFFGDYWIVALGPETVDDSYEWAIVSGGPPITKTKYGCRTGLEDIPFEEQENGIGFWLFAHKQIDPLATLKMRNVAKHLGYDLTVLEYVEHRGCLYLD